MLDIVQSIQVNTNAEPIGSKDCTNSVVFIHVRNVGIALIACQFFMVTGMNDFFFGYTMRRIFIEK